VPTSPRLSHHWYECFDLGWLVIKVLCALGLAKLRAPALARIPTAPRRAA
jgi:fatty-acid desaturase